MLFPPLLKSWYTWRRKPCSRVTGEFRFGPVGCDVLTRRRQKAWVPLVIGEPRYMKVVVVDCGKH